MNSENDSQKNNSIEAIEADEVSSIDDFIKELEAKEQDLSLSDDAPVIQFEISDGQNDELAELEKLLKAIEAAPPAPIPPISTPNAPPAPALQIKPEILTALENDNSKLRTELSKAKKENAEMVESFRRRQSDFDNFKKRIERERSDTHRTILSRLAGQMIPVVDNLNRALDSASGQEAGKSADFQQFIQGIVLVNHQLNDVLEEIGVHPIIAVGEMFDPHFHEAVATVQTGEVPPNTVVAELLRGYKIEDKVIRPAMVRVASAATAETPDLLELE
jgi:molecular chaperone GrpE